jgi:hypothetical protein
MIREGRFRNFLLYAIGEILLVVAGILLALQINNGYEYKIDRKQESAILQSLKFEQKENKDQLKEKILGIKERIKNDSIILQQIHSDQPIVEEEELLRMLSVATFPITFDPSNGTIEDILNSGKINLIRSDTLRIAISEWESEIAEVKEAEKYLLELAIMQLQDYLSDKLVSRRVYVEYMGQSQHVQSFTFFQDLQFENLMINSLLNLNLLEDRYLMIRGEIDHMCEIIEEELSR